MKMIIIILLSLQTASNKIYMLTECDAIFSLFVAVTLSYHRIFFYFLVYLGEGRGKGWSTTRNLFQAQI